MTLLSFNLLVSMGVAILLLIIQIKKKIEKFCMRCLFKN
jgi:hypothetical protein